MCDKCEEKLSVLPEKLITACELTTTLAPEYETLKEDKLRLLDLFAGKWLRIQLKEDFFS